MPDIVHDVPIESDLDSVFECISTSDGLAKWWSKGGTGDRRVGGAFEFDFGPEYQWKALVEEFEAGKSFAIRMTEADPDWNETLVRFRLDKTDQNVMLRFEHLGWPKDNEHYRSSSYCWAMYLRCLKNYLEKGVELSYEQRFMGE